MKKEKDNSSYDSLFNYCPEETMCTGGVPDIDQSFKNDRGKVISSSRISLWKNYPFCVDTGGVEWRRITRLYKI